MRQPHRRALPALIALGVAAGTTVICAPDAFADPDCGRPPVQYSVDGGAHWSASAAMPAESGTVQVRLAGEPTAGCDYHVSLASYATQGATWADSGTQTFLGWATATLNRGNPHATLDLGSHLPPCYGEIALYGLDEAYDGSDSDHPLPHYPDEPFSGLGIATWNGGAACTASPSPSASTGPTAPASSSAAPVAPSAPPSAATSTTRPPTAPATGTATTGPAATAHPTAAAGPALAFTGTDSGRLATTAGIGAALLGAGAATVLVTRRRARRG